MELEFVTTPQNLEDYKCPTCRKVLLEPHATECCGTHVCRRCLFTDEEKNIIKCPECQRSDTNHIRYKPYEKIIGEFHVYCSNKSRGCGKDMLVGELQDHLQVCQYVEVTCSYGCGESLLRKDLKDHEENQCPKRPTNCEYCNDSGEFKFITSAEHLESCPDYPVECPKQCKDGEEVRRVKRKDLAKHSKVCPLEPVECPDCHNNEILRQDQVKHGKICLKRKTTCVHGCGTEGAYDYITELHTKECPEISVKCPRKCESTPIKRKMLSEHAKRCPLEPVDCPFKHAGCRKNLVRQDLADHMESSQQSHILKLNGAYHHHVELSSQVRTLIANEVCKMESKVPKPKQTGGVSMGASNAPMLGMDPEIIRKSFNYIKTALNPCLKFKGSQDVLHFRATELPTVYFYVTIGPGYDLRFGLTSINIDGKGSSMRIDCEDNSEKVQQVNNIDSCWVLRVKVTPLTGGKPAIREIQLNQCLPSNNQDCVDKLASANRGQKKVAKDIEFHANKREELDTEISLKSTICPMCKFENTIDSVTCSMCKKHL